MPRIAEVALTCEHDRQVGLNLRLKADKYGCVDVTLDGQPAKIIGFAMRFATIVTIDPHGPHFEWSWEAVDRIVAAGGAFKS